VSIKIRTAANVMLAAMREPTHSLRVDGVDVRAAFDRLRALCDEMFARGMSGLRGESREARVKTGGGDAE